MLNCKAGLTLRADLILPLTFLIPILIGISGQGTVKGRVALPALDRVCGEVKPMARGTQVAIADALAPLPQDHPFRVLAKDWKRRGDSIRTCRGEQVKR